MSSRIKRSLIDLTNDNKRLKNDSAIDLYFDIGELKTNKSQSLSSVNDDSIFDDDVFEDEQNGSISLSKTNQSQIRKRLNGTSTYRIKETKSKQKKKYIKNENIIVDDDTLNQLREEQARIDAHSLSINHK